MKNDANNKRILTSTITVFRDTSDTKYLFLQVAGLARHAFPQNRPKSSLSLPKINLQINGKYAQKLAQTGHQRPNRLQHNAPRTLWDSYSAVLSSKTHAETAKHMLKDVNEIGLGRKTDAAFAIRGPQTKTHRTQWTPKETKILLRFG